MAMQNAHRAVRFGAWLVPLAGLALASGLTFAPVAHEAEAAGTGIQSISGGLSSAGDKSGLKPTDTSRTLESAIGTLINSVLSIVGVLLLVYLIWGGFTWMTAGGDSKKVDQAQSIIKNAVIGLVIIVLSYFIADFVMRQLVTVTTGSPAPTPGGPTP
jgi:hypothetical protein